MCHLSHLSTEQEGEECYGDLECEKGIEPINSWRDLGNDFRPWSVELRKTFSLMDKLGIKPHIADKKYFDEKMKYFFLRTALIPFYPYLMFPNHT